jgi:hypothetical protein
MVAFDLTMSLPAVSATTPTTTSTGRVLLVVASPILRAATASSPRPGGSCGLMATRLSGP